MKIDCDQIKKIESDLGEFSKRALPYATRATVNGAAFHAQGEARTGVRNAMVNRNKFTVQSIRVNKTSSLQVGTQAAAVGSTAGYMETQEFGGVKRKQGGVGVAIATSYSAGQGRDAKPRTRLPRKPNALASIKLQKAKRRGANRAQRNIIAIREATKSGGKFVYLDLARRKGLFRVIGKKRAKLQMVHDLSSTSVRIPATPWLRPAVLRTVPQMPRLYAEALQFQIDREKLFKQQRGS